MQLHALIRGRVQGVCYRAWTQDQAGALGLTGWVRNRADGSVELLAQGARDPLEALLRLCRRGPPAARVEQVQVDWLETEAADFTEFRIESSR